MATRHNSATGENVAFRVHQKAVLATGWKIEKFFKIYKYNFGKITKNRGNIPQKYKNYANVDNFTTDQTC